MSVILTISLNARRIDKLKDKDFDILDDSQLRKYILGLLDTDLGLENVENGE